MEQTKAVRVSYVPKGFGLALEIDETGELALDQGIGDDGVLTISDGSITLELPTADGKVSTLAWDPAEVAWESLIA